MQELAELADQNILLVEDDFFIASNTADALERAGARIIGPSASADEARALLARTNPTLAVLDLNLGEGHPRFDLARLVAARGIPLLFLSGYDRDILPGDLSGAAWLNKPAQPQQIVEAIRHLCARPEDGSPRLQ